ncbi:hypothetical protein HBI24_202350 [Parastagonospora nodorum]|nr:hypothetical protein HBI24_202350 [Parastagonospora nodorum]
MRYDVRFHFDCAPHCDLHAKDPASLQSGCSGHHCRRACIMLKKNYLPFPPVLNGIFDAR